MKSYFKNPLYFALIVAFGFATTLPMTAEAAHLTIYYDLKNKARVAEIEKLLGQHPGDLSLRYELVDIFVQEYFFELAIQQVKTIMVYDKEDAAAPQLLALLLVRSEQINYKDAIEVLRTALQHHPTRSDIRSNLALLHSELHECDLAIQEAKEALKYSQDTAEEASLFLILATNDKLQRSKYLEKARSLDPSIDVPRPTTVRVPVYIGKRPFIEFPTHPKWTTRIKRLDNSIKEKW